MDLDHETKTDLMEAFHELYQEVESCLAVLVKSPEDAAIHRLFRAIHNIKGNAGILQIEAVVNFSHAIEDVAGSLRLKNYTMTEAISEVILIGMDRLEDLHKQELFDKKFEYLRIEELIRFYQSLASAKKDNSNEIALQALQFLGAGIDSELAETSLNTGKKENQIIPIFSENHEEKIYNDLTFFQEIGLQLDNQMDAFFGRSIQLYDWAMKMNQLSGNLIDEKQLAAAIYLHDIGMSYLPSELWACKLNATIDELNQLKLHPNWGYGFLARIPGWEEAATIIQQHHENINGTGYPEGLKGQAIHDGAKILAILDTFFLLTNGRVDQSERQSTVRAISAVNARIDTEFEGMWVQCFNHVIRAELKAGNI